MLTGYQHKLQVQILYGFFSLSKNVEEVGLLVCQI